MRRSAGRLSGFGLHDAATRGWVAIDANPNGYYRQSRPRRLTFMVQKHLVRALTIVLAIGFGQRFSGAQAAVPFTSAADGHDTIPAYVNGRGPFAFILDTGADGSALYPWFAEKEHLPKGTVRDVSGH